MSSTITSTALEIKHPTVPMPYVVGRTLNVKTLDGEDVQVTIKRTYPITISPVMEVSAHLPDGDLTAILKFYDRRFGRLRENRPFTPETETMWRNCVRSGLAQKVIDDLMSEEKSIWMARFQTNQDDGNEQSDDDDDDDDDSDGEILLQEDEAMIYHKTRKYFTNEVRAYTQLENLQGQCIPKFIASVNLPAPNAPTDLPSAFFDTPGVLLEYIPGFPLSDLPSQIPDQPRLWEDIIHSAIEVARQVNREGVVHSDCQPRNVLVAESKTGKTGNVRYQPYMIDFAQCVFKADYRDTEDLDDDNGYASVVYRVDNHGAIAVLMSQRVARTTSYSIHIEGVEDS